MVIAIHRLFHFHNYIKVFDNEGKLPLSTMAATASKLFQRLHNEGLITQDLTMDWYCERFCNMNLVEDEDVNQTEIYESIRIITEARSS
jgi:methionyl-tRNA synthetase